MQAELTGHEALTSAGARGCFKPSTTSEHLDRTGTRRRTEWTFNSELGSGCCAGVTMITAVRCWFGTSQWRIRAPKKAWGSRAARRGRWQVIDARSFRGLDQNSCRLKLDQRSEPMTSSDTSRLRRLRLTEHLVQNQNPARSAQSRLYWIGKHTLSVFGAFI